MSNSSLLSCLLIFFVIGSIIFLFGFFPASYQNISINKTNLTNGYPNEFFEDIRIDGPSKKYNQTVLMIIDAFRLDFVSSSDMPFSQRLCANLNIKANIPTVTMPRLKSLTTGTVSNYIDIVLNLGNNQELSDSIVHRLKSRGDAIVFAGDRTWTNLFPTQFDRQYPNMDSFFVDDFYEGDENITRVLDKELFAKDWTLLVLHYLGLDHIGHVEGSESKKIPMKLREMDNQMQNSLLLVTGDHGMRNGGSHGGSTYEELHVPLLIFKETCRNQSFKRTTYKQVDLAPTLAILWAIPIPSTSIGCLIVELLEDLSLEEQLYALYYNSHHLMEKAIATFGKAVAENSMYLKWHTAGKESHKEFLMEKSVQGKSSSFLFEKAKMDYMRASRSVSDLLSESMAKFDYDLISIGIALTSLSTIFGFIHFANTNKRDFFEHRQMLLAFIAGTAITLWCQYMGYFIRSNQFYNYLLALPIATSMYLFLKTFVALSSFRWKPISQKTLWLLACFIIQTLTLASSSFIEYEQQSWYYMGITILIVMCFKMFRSKCNLKEISGSNVILNTLSTSLGTLRLAIPIISIIAVFKKLLDTSHSQLNDNAVYLSVWTGAGLITMILQLRNSIVPYQQIAAVFIALSIYCYRSINGTLLLPFITNISFIPFLYFIPIGIVVIMLVPLRNVKRNGSFRKYDGALRSGLCCMLLIGALLHKPHNIPLIPIMFSTLEMVYKMCNALLKDRTVLVFHKTAITIFVGNMFYYLQGNTNSLATIDLNPGYIGQTTYNPIIVAILVTLNTYSGPINAFLHLVVHIRTSHKGEHQCATKGLEVVLGIYAMATITPVAVYFCLLVLFRYHLFIYSVFAPKALYAFYSVCVFFLKFSLTCLFLYLVK